MRLVGPVAIRFTNTSRVVSILAIAFSITSNLTSRFVLLVVEDAGDSCSHPLEVPTSTSVPRSQRTVFVSVCHQTLNWPLNYYHPWNALGWNSDKLQAHTTADIALVVTESHQLTWPSPQPSQLRSEGWGRGYSWPIKYTYGMLTSVGLWSWYVNHTCQSWKNWVLSYCNLYLEQLHSLWNCADLLRRLIVNWQFMRWDQNVAQSLYSRELPIWISHQHMSVLYLSLNGGMRAGESSWSGDEVIQ